MSPVSTDETEFADQQAFLRTGVGQAGSGAVRYAAAMYFYGQRLMPAEMLEIYRRCSKFDREDPVDLARFEGIDITRVPLLGTAVNSA